MTSSLHLPSWEARPSPDDLGTIYSAALLAYDSIRKEMEAKYPRGTLIVIDGRDRTGKVHTVGIDAIAIQEQHYRDYPRAFATSCLLTIGRS